MSASDTPNTPRELLERSSLNHSHTCTCKVCRTLSYIQEHELNTHEVAIVCHIISSLSLKGVHLIIEEAIENRDYGDAMILCNISGLLASLVQLSAQFREILDDTKFFLDKET